MKQMLIAIQFLTIIPVPVKGACSAEELAHSASFFPLAGALQGLLIALAAFSAIKIFPVEMVSVFVILVLLLSNGGFDLDGLIDTFDALAVKSTGDRERDMEKRLSVMKDSSIGAVGAIALVMAVLLKFVLLNNFLHILTLPAALSFLFIVPVFSKWVTVIAMFQGRPARKDGLGQIFINRVRIKQVIISSLILFVLYMAVAGPYHYPVYVMRTMGLFAVLCILLCLLALITIGFTAGKFGGLTGDHLGALSEIAEIILLAAIPVWSQHCT
ncbi:MAG: adenosylcobinamide-GDP ribazoletransferase [Dissulfurispiraceae bacterium]|jgi:adenosylcobinamide-GDP ribazoletransferase